MHNGYNENNVTVTVTLSAQVMASKLRSCRSNTTLPDCTSMDIVSDR